MIQKPDWLPAVEAELKTAYQAPGRAYHNWNHILYLLGEFHRLAAQWRKSAAVEAAIYWHDAIYDPTSNTNEADSAALMVERLQGRADLQLISDANDLILATASHDVPQDMGDDLAKDCALFLDMDMSILGADPDLFDTYDQAIREEYIMIPDAIYRPRRAEVLIGFLNRENLFLTDAYRRSHETKARDNLKRAIERLA